MEDQQANLARLYGANFRLKESSKDVQERFISVVYTLLGTTQGLALSALAGKIPEASKLGMNMQTFAEISDVLVCFMVISRVSQTYISAAVGFIQRTFNSIDILSILFVGLMQGWLIQSIGDGASGHSYLHLKVLILSMIAVLLHGYALHKEASHNSKVLNFDLQVLNIFLATLIGLMACGGGLSNDPYAKSVLSIGISSLLLLNIIGSLRRTDFTGRDVVELS